MTSVCNPEQTEKRSQLTAQLRQGIAQVRDSKRFAEYLAFAGRFHRYSFNNRLLIWMQRPEATQVAGFQSWKQLGRHVKKGEKGIAILAPIAFKREMDLGPTQSTESAEDRTVVGFRVVHVFDVGQTDGEPLPTLTMQLEGSADELLMRLMAVAADDGLTVTSEPEQGRDGVGGYYDPAERHIWLNPSIQGTAQIAQTLAHELGHHFARETVCSRAEGEIIADAAAFLVLGHYGVDAGAFSFEYVAVWANRAEPGAFERKLNEAHQAADAILSRMNPARHL